MADLTDEMMGDLKCIFIHLLVTHAATAATSFVHLEICTYHPAPLTVVVRICNASAIPSRIKNCPSPPPVLKYTRSAYDKFRYFDGSHSRGALSSLSNADGGGGGATEPRMKSSSSSIDELPASVSELHTTETTNLKRTVRAAIKARLSDGKL